MDQEGASWYVQGNQVRRRLPPWRALGLSVGVGGAAASCRPPNRTATSKCCWLFLAADSQPAAKRGLGVLEWTGALVPQARDAL